jgi:hypothetical protein
MSSLVSNTPLLISARFQQIPNKQTNSFFNVSNSYVYSDNEQLHLTLSRLLSMEVREALNLRSALQTLQISLNKAAAQFLANWLG